MPLKSTVSRFLFVCAVASLSACAMQTDRPDNIAQTDLLSDYHWDLTSAQGTTPSNWVPPKTRDGQPLRLSFQDQRVSISGLCNRMAAGYTVTADKISITQPMSTMMACGNDGVMQYEQEIGKLLPQARTWAINNNASVPSLTLSFNDGVQWTLTGTPTDETRYGGPGETEFLEVAAQRVACSHPLIPNMQCLNVREIKYDSAGIKSSVGNWHAFYDTIQGYTHQPGVRNVLRVKRYERAQVPADASRNVYVLDMVVESAKE
jgi:heat shock protein HslJ